jgi:hypothetical protein
MNIQTHPHAFDVIHPIKPLVLFHSIDLTFRLNARFFSILNGKDEFLVVQRMYIRSHRNSVEDANTSSEFKLRNLRWYENRFPFDVCHYDTVSTCATVRQLITKPCVQCTVPVLIYSGLWIATTDMRHICIFGNMHSQAIPKYAYFWNMHSHAILEYAYFWNMHSQAISENAYYQNMHSLDVFVCWLSKIVEKSSDCRPLAREPRAPFGLCKLRYFSLNTKLVLKWNQDPDENDICLGRMIYRKEKTLNV